MYSQRINTKPINLEFFGFMALKNQELSLEYLEGHSGVLRAFNIPKVGSEDRSWMTKEGSLVVVVRETVSHQLVGGGRLEVANDSSILPLAETMMQLEQNFDVDKYFGSKKGVAELSGLWTERSSRMKGLSTTIISLLNICGRRMNLEMGTALCSPFSIKRFLSAGWVLVDEIGEGGYFYYPNSDYRSAFMVKKFDGRFSKGEREIFRTTLEEKVHISLETRTTGNFVFRFDLRSVPLNVKV